MTNKNNSTSYDETPYPNLSHARTHPDHLATLATIFGLHPAPVDHCNVLELGCAGGGNLIPMAYGLPESNFVGIDYTASQINEGRETIDALGITNLTLEYANVMDLSNNLGRFDYIIAHGLYSWVAAPVRDKIMQICQRSLADQGIAYISYNTYPGWHMMDIVRDMMQYRTRNIEEPEARANAARSFISFINDSSDSEHSIYFAFLEGYQNSVLNKTDEGPAASDALLLHDVLEDTNRPVNFYQFAEHATRHGLQYLTDADFSSATPSSLSPQVVQELRVLAKNTIELEQYMDFLRNRAFRQSLLCHADVNIDRMIRPEIVRRLMISSRARPDSKEPDITTVSKEKFKGLDGSIFTTDHPITKAAFQLLNEVSPSSVTFNRLFAEASARTSLKVDHEWDKDTQILAANLLRAYGYSDKLVEFHVHAADFAVRVSERPVASEVARWQADHEYKITNMRHERVSLEDLSRQIVKRLDGHQSSDDLLETIYKLYRSGKIRLPGDEQPPADSLKAREKLANELGFNLDFLARAAVLIA
jgi:methyltransferase-like protein/ubiquinone/menaquinone biosynthesis C-methylase UbiE